MCGYGCLSTALTSQLAGAKCETPTKRMSAKAGIMVGDMLTFCKQSTELMVLAGFHDVIAIENKCHDLNFEVPQQECDSKVNFIMTLHPAEVY